MAGGSGPAAGSGSLLLRKCLLGLHRAPPLRKLFGGSFAASLLLTLRCRHSRRISRWHVRMRRACCPTFRCRFVGRTGSSVPPLLSCLISVHRVDPGEARRTLSHEDVLPTKHGAHEPQLAAEVGTLRNVFRHQVGVVHPYQQVDGSSPHRGGLGGEDIRPKQDLQIFQNTAQRYGSLLGASP